MDDKNISNRLLDIYIKFLLDNKFIDNIEQFKLFYTFEIKNYPISLNSELTEEYLVIYDKRNKQIFEIKQNNSTVELSLNKNKYNY